jgi:thiol-disulfide isomerase/thioredoxin
LQTNDTMHWLWILIISLLGLKAESGVVPPRSRPAAFVARRQLQQSLVVRHHVACDSVDPDVVEENHHHHHHGHHLVLTQLRGGDQEQQLTLDQKVQAAMIKLGLKSPGEDAENSNSNNTTDETTISTAGDNAQECEGGVCPAPPPALSAESSSSSSSETTTATTTLPAAAATIQHEEDEEDVATLAQKIADSMNVHSSLAMAALGATAVDDASTAAVGDGSKKSSRTRRTYNEQAARAMVQQELDIIATVAADSAQVQQLVSEGFDSFLSRRALAFADMEMDDARAILLADQEDERQEEKERKEQQEKLEQQVENKNDDNTMPVFKTVNVDSSFDPTKLSTTTAAPTPPTKANKADVVFEATAAQVQELVLESPVPVLLDVYADWCGPCKVLGPILEDLAIKSGGLFRLVKIDSDNERAVSAALQVTALPTVFGIRDGRIIHMFQGMPSSEEAMKNFLLGVIMPGGEANFAPALTSAQTKLYTELTSKLVKMAGSSCFSFSARERLQDRIATMLETLVEQTSGDPSIAEESAVVVRSFIANVIRDPTETKFRQVNLNNAVVKDKIVKYPAALAMLHVVGFSSSSSSDDAGAASLMLGKGKKMVNVAPLTVARDAIDQWIDKSRYEIARAARKRKDEEDRIRLEAEGAFDKDDGEDDDAEEEAKEVVNLNVCKIKLRMDGKKKVLDVELGADEPLQAILQHLPVPLANDEEVRITCVAKRLVVKSSDETMMHKSFRELGLSPAASVVVKVGADAVDDAAAAAVAASSTGTSSAGGKLAERVTSQRKKKKGSHTMQSVGIYGKDDNAKGELIDGGGGTLYEQDVSDDEDEKDKTEAEQDEKPTEAEDATITTPDATTEDSDEAGEDEQDLDDAEGDDKD